MKKNYLLFDSLKFQSRFFVKVSVLVIVLFVTTGVFAVEKYTQNVFEKDTLTSQESEMLVQNAEVSSSVNRDAEIEGKKESLPAAPKLLNGKERGYIVTVNSSSEKFKHVVTTDPERVVKIFQAYFGTDLDIMKILNYSPYFDMNTDDIYFYAEKGTVHEGKDGKLKFRKTKKSRK